MWYINNAIVRYFTYTFPLNIEGLQKTIAKMPLVSGPKIQIMMTDKSSSTSFDMPLR
jgi:hypothetical protein